MNTPNNSKPYDFTRSSLLTLGVIYGALWSLAPGILSELLWSPWQAITVLVAGMLTGTIVTFALAPRLRRMNLIQGTLLGVLSLPFGASMFGMLISCLHWIVLKSTGIHYRFVMEIEEPPGYVWAPLEAAWQYATGSTFTFFAIGLMPLAILTTLHLQAVVRRPVSHTNMAT
jgi:hypothetical protein